jgi:hypothetical protein
MQARRAYLLSRLHGKEISPGLAPRAFIEICDVVLRLLAASVVHSSILNKWNRRDAALINAPSLAYLMESAKV